MRTLLRCGRVLHLNRPLVTVTAPIVPPHTAAHAGADKTDSPRSHELDESLATRYTSVEYIRDRGDGYHIFVALVSAKIMNSSTTDQRPIDEPSDGLK